MEDFLDEKSKLIVTLFEKLDNIQIAIDHKSKESFFLLNGERYLTDEELSKKIRLSRRTLQEYRTEGKIPYYQIGGKVLYKQSDIIKMFEKGYRKPYKEEEI